jgi:purine-cytosine permease-like protein
MTEKKCIELTKLQGIIAIASFTTGVVIAAVCLFWVPPLGEIANSAISIVSELLVLCGAILGVKASYDTKLRKFEAELRQVIDNENKNNE